MLRFALVLSIVGAAASARAQVDGGAPPDGGEVSAEEIDIGAQVRRRRRGQGQAVGVGRHGGRHRRARRRRPALCRDAADQRLGLRRRHGPHLQRAQPRHQRHRRLRRRLVPGRRRHHQERRRSAVDRLQGAGDRAGAAGVVDPYFRADIFLTIPNLSGIEVEEAFLTTTHLPGNFQIKAGIFRAGLGRQNTQHLHLQDFTRRPAINPQFLGVDGLRAPGLEVNWLVPADSVLPGAVGVGIFGGAGRGRPAAADVRAAAPAGISRTWARRGPSSRCRRPSRSTRD